MKENNESKAQQNYQSSIEQAGGVYFVAKDFERFNNWYIKGGFNDRS